MKGLNPSGKSTLMVNDLEVVNTQAELLTPVF